MIGGHGEDERRRDRTDASGARLDIDDRHLPEPVARTEDGDADITARFAFLDDLELTRDHHEHLRRGVTFFDDHLTGLDAAGGNRRGQ